MEELCQPSMNSRDGPITPFNIQATDFGLKNHMIQQVQLSCQYHGLPGDDANKHIDKDTINVAAGGTFMKRRPEECYVLIENMMLTTITGIPQLKGQVNIVNPSCETCGGPHHCSKCQAAGGFTQGDVYAATGNYNARANQMKKIEKAINERPQGALLSNTIPNHREEIKVITTRSGINLAGPSVPSPNPPSSSKEVERDPKTTMDQVHISSSESIARVPSPIIQPAPTSKSNETPERNPHQPPIPYPSRLNKDKLQDKSDIQIHKFL
ncbi:hypothetical protein Tco_0759233 [Tanacetum coccineum]